MKEILIELGIGAGLIFFGVLIVLVLVAAKWHKWGKWI